MHMYVLYAAWPDLIFQEGHERARSSKYLVLVFLTFLLSSLSWIGCYSVIYVTIPREIGREKGIEREREKNGEG